MPCEQCALLEKRVADLEESMRMMIAVVAQHEKELYEPEPAIIVPDTVN